MWNLLVVCVTTELWSSGERTRLMYSSSKVSKFMGFFSYKNISDVSILINENVLSV